MFISVSVHASDVACADIREKVKNCSRHADTVNVTPDMSMSVETVECILHGYVAQIRTLMNL